MKDNKRKLLRAKYHIETSGQWAPPTYTEWLEDKVIEKDKKPLVGRDMSLDINPYSARDMTKAKKT